MLKLKVMVVRKVIVVHRIHRQGEIRAQVIVHHRGAEKRGKRKVQQEIIKGVYHKQTQLPPLSQW